MSEIDYAKIRIFWDLQARKYEKTKSWSVTNLEEDYKLQKMKIKIEREKIEKYIILKKCDILLDLGSGIGYWSMYFAKRCKRVISVEYSERMQETAKELTRNSSINNIEFITKNVLDFKSNEKYDIIFISGLLIYIRDSDINQLQSNILEYSKKNTIIILRDGTGIQKRYIINNKYSEALKTRYSAIYRTREEYIRIFTDLGFINLKDEDMFDKSSALNKWEETRLRIYKFIRIKS